MGKGITYDTGGADIKAGGHMAGMSRWSECFLFLILSCPTNLPFFQIIIFLFYFKVFIQLSYNQLTMCICICCWCSGISAEQRRPPGSWRRWQSSSPRWEYKGVPVQPLIHKRTAVDTFSLHWGLPLCQISFFSDWNASPNKLFLLYTVLVGFAKYRRYLPRGINGKNQCCGAKIIYVRLRVHIFPLFRLQL